MAYERVKPTYKEIIYTFLKQT